MEVADPPGLLAFPFGGAAVAPPVAVDMSMMQTLPPPPPLPAPPTPADHAAEVAAAAAAAANAVIAAGGGVGGLEGEGSAGNGGIGTIMAVDDDDEDGAGGGGGGGGGGFGGGPHTPVTPAAGGGTASGTADALPPDDADVEARLRLLARAVLAVDFDDAKTKATVFIPRALIHNALLQLVPLVTGGGASAPPLAGGAAPLSSPPPRPPPSASRLAAALATKRIGYWARAVFGLRSPKTARLETRRDVEVSFKGQPPALREPDIRSFLATAAAGHPDEDGRRVFSLRFFRLRLAADFRAPDCCLTAAEVGALRDVLAPPTVAAVMGVALRTDEPGGAVTGLRIPPGLVLSPHPRLGRALSYPQHGLRVGRKRPRGRGVSAEGGDAGGPPLLAGDVASPSAGDAAAGTPAAAAAAASAAMVAAVVAAAAAAVPGGAASGAAAAPPPAAQPGLPVVQSAVAGPAAVPAYPPSPDHSLSLLHSLPPVVLAGHPLHPPPDGHIALPPAAHPPLRPRPPTGSHPPVTHMRVAAGTVPRFPAGAALVLFPLPLGPPPRGTGAVTWEVRAAPSPAAPWRVEVVVSWAPPPTAAAGGPAAVAAAGGVGLAAAALGVEPEDLTWLGGEDPAGEEGGGAAAAVGWTRVVGVDLGVWLDVGAAEAAPGGGGVLLSVPVKELRKEQSTGVRTL